MVLSLVREDVMWMVAALHLDLCSRRFCVETTEWLLVMVTLFTLSEANEEEPSETFVTRMQCSHPLRLAQVV